MQERSLRVKHGIIPTKLRYVRVYSDKGPNLFRASNESSNGGKKNKILNISKFDFNKNLPLRLGKKNHRFHYDLSDLTSMFTTILRSKTEPITIQVVVQTLSQTAQCAGAIISMIHKHTLAM